MKKPLILASLITLCVLSANAAPKYSGEISAEHHNPGYDNTLIDSIPEEAVLVCSFGTADIVANHTVELNIRAKKSNGKYTKWRSVTYNPEVNYDYAEQSVMTEAIDRNILKAAGGHEIYDKRRDKQVPEKTVIVTLPSFDDVTDDIEQYEIKIKYTNDCLRTGRCLWAIQ